MVLTGKQFEDQFEQILIVNNLSYKREGEKNAYGHKSSKGRFDFEIFDPPVAIELKVIERQSKLTIPGLSKRTHKPIKQPMIKQHQVKALRAFRGQAYVLCHVTEEKQSYVISERQIRDVVARDVWKRNLKDEMQPVNVEEWIKEICDV